jgi:hypothetical protein
MSAYTWPLTLPQLVNDDLSGSEGLRVLRTPMDKGVAKMRLLGDRADPIAVKFHMSAAQIVILRNFIKNTILGVRRFDFTHPVTGDPIEVRIVPDSDGRFFDYTVFGHEEYLVSMTFEIMP